MHVVHVIGSSLMVLVLVLTYLFLYEESWSSYLKMVFSIWYSWITMECFIKYVQNNFKIRAIWILRHWLGLILLGICMCVTKYWEVTEDDMKKVSVYAVTYYFVWIFMMVDLIPDTMNEDNGDDDRAIISAYRLVIDDLIQLLQDQQEFRERMNGVPFLWVFVVSIS